MNKMKSKITGSFLFQRILEIIIPFLSWFIITLPLWLSPFHPAVVSYFIIAFDLYFFYKSIKTAYYSVISYQKIIYHSKINYSKKISKKSKSKKIHHFIIIPNYKEPIYKLESTINSIVNNDYPWKNIYLVLAFEKREENEATKKYQLLLKKFKKNFKKIFATYHPDLPNEEPGKASNQTYAAKII
ncbi:MAG: hypothetical protein ACPLRN_01260, partial [Microgenomates group bacterium]